MSVISQITSKRTWVRRRPSDIWATLYDVCLSTTYMKLSSNSQVESRSLRKEASGVVADGPSTAGVIPSMMAAVNSLLEPKMTTSSLSFFGVAIALVFDGDTIVAMELSEGKVTGGGEPAGRATIISALAE